MDLIRIGGQVRYVDRSFNSHHPKKPGGRSGDGLRAEPRCNARGPARNDLRASKARSAALLRAIPDQMFLQTTEGVIIDYHAPHPDRLFVAPEQFNGRNMRNVLQEVVLRHLEPAFEQAASQCQRASPDAGA